MSLWNLSLWHSNSYDAWVSYITPRRHTSHLAWRKIRWIWWISSLIEVFRKTIGPLFLEIISRPIRKSKHRVTCSDCAWPIWLPYTMMWLTVWVWREWRDTASLYLKGRNMTGLVEFQVSGKQAGLIGSKNMRSNSGWLGMTFLRVLKC